MKYHVSISKDYLINIIKKDEEDKFLGGVINQLGSETLKDIEASSKKYFTLSDCDNTDKEGICLGHDYKE